jgi:hypothetical protein
MILLKENLIVQGPLRERIVRWEVWFRTPWGLCVNTADAVEAMKDVEGIDINSMLIPVAVAISNSTHEIMFS